MLHACLHQPSIAHSVRLSEALKEMAPKRIYLVRHGETASNAAKILMGQLDMPISGRGAEQAAALGKAFRDRGVRFDVAWSSDLVRASRTAEIILAEQGGEPIPLLTSPKIRERHLGDLQGKPWIPVSQRGGWGVEADGAFTKRVHSFWSDELFAALTVDAENVLLVLHGGSLFTLVVRVLIAQGFSVRGDVPTPGWQSFPNCSVTLVEASEPEQGELVTMADASWLEGKVQTVADHHSA